jgi:hypothetical protein
LDFLALHLYEYIFLLEAPDPIMEFELMLNGCDIGRVTGVSVATSLGALLRYMSICNFIEFLLNFFRALIPE